MSGHQPLATAEMPLLSSLLSPLATHGLRSRCAATAPTEMNNVTDMKQDHSDTTAHSGRSAWRLVGSMVVIGLAGCTSVGSVFKGDKVDYRAQSAQTQGLEVPPDLTQLARDSRYKQDGSGVVSATTYQPPSFANTTTGGGGPNALGVAPNTDPNVTIERSGNDRWIVTTLTPEQVWPKLKQFWAERGFSLAVEQADVGVMETEWNENRSKIPQDFIRSTIGLVLDSAWDSGERDRYRTRVERGANGSEIYVSHRGAVEVLTGSNKDSSTWQPRAPEPELEAEMLRRLLLKLGAPEEKATALVAPGALPPARARLLAGAPAGTIEVDEDFDRAWRRVGLALDRSGFAVEDRDRAKGFYYVSYTDQNEAPTKQEPGMISKLLNFSGFGSEKKDPKQAVRYRVQVQGDAQRSKVIVQNSEGGAPDNEVATRLAQVLVDDLK